MEVYVEVGSGPHGYITPAILGSPKRGQNQNGYITLAVLGTHMWAKWLHNPGHLGGLQSRDEIRSG